MFNELLEKLALALDAHKVPYMIIGGQAVLLYGDARLTKDIDLTLGKDPSSLPEILEIIQKLQWKVLVDHPSDFTAKTWVLPCQDPASGIRLDFIFSLSTYEEKALGRAREVPLGKAKVKFASPEDLIIHKILAGRPRDLEDSRSVLRKNPKLDIGYIQQQLKELEVLTGKNLLDSFLNIQ